MAFSGSIAGWPAARYLVAGLTSLLVVVTLTTTVAAQDDDFEIVVPIPTVVRAPEGSETVLSRTTTPPDLVGEECGVTARSENQSSVHPENDLVVASGGSEIVLPDVESAPGAVVTASDTLVLGDEIVITLIMGPDKVFSAGIEVRFQCPPVTTTTTKATTTTQAATTTTKGVTTTQGATTTTQGATTTTQGATTTTQGATTTTDGATTTTQGATTTTREVIITTIATTTTTLAPTTSQATTTTTLAPTTSQLTTSTTIVDEVMGTEVLPFTGFDDGGFGLFALALGAAGLSLVVASRSWMPRLVTVYFTRPTTCAVCDLDAVFSTPHGRLCFSHTRQALHDDSELWMPDRLD